MQSNKEGKQSETNKQEKKHDFTERNRLLTEITAKVTNQNRNLTLDSALFELWSIIGGMGDFIGREFYIIYENDRPVKLVQKPIRTKTLLTIFKEFEKYRQREKKKAEKQTPKTLSGRRM